MTRPLVRIVRREAARLGMLRAGVDVGLAAGVCCRRARIIGDGRSGGGACTGVPARFSPSPQRPSWSTFGRVRWLQMESSVPAIGWWSPRQTRSRCCWPPWQCPVRAVSRALVNAMRDDEIAHVVQGR